MKSYWSYQAEAVLEAKEADPLAAASKEGALLAAAVAVREVAHLEAVAAREVAPMVAEVMEVAPVVAAVKEVASLAAALMGVAMAAALMEAATAAQSSRLPEGGDA